MEKKKKFELKITTFYVLYINKYFIYNIIIIIIFEYKSQYTIFNSNFHFFDTIILFLFLSII